RGNVLRRIETPNYLGRNAVFERALAILADQRTLVISPFGDAFSSWDLISAVQLHEAKAGRAGDLDKEAGPWFFPSCSPDGKSIYVVSRDDWKFSGNGSTLAKRQDKSLVELRDARTGAKVRSFTVAAEPIRDLAQSSDGKILSAIVSASFDHLQKTIFVW